MIQSPGIISIYTHVTSPAGLDKVMMEKRRERESWETRKAQKVGGLDLFVGSGSIRLQQSLSRSIFFCLIFEDYTHKTLLNLFAHLNFDT